MDDNKFLPKLSQNFLELLNDDEYYDITIEVGNDPYKNDGILTHIKLPNILPEIFQIILRYIYGGRLSLKEYNVTDIIKILIAANELSLQEIIIHLQSFLIENKKNWLEQNFNLIYGTSFENESFLELQNFCTELITKEPNKIFKSIDFNSISEKTLISLIRHENLKISDVQVWEHVLVWGIAQNPELSSDPDPSSYSKNDFNSLKNTLQQCIPFIKFYNLTSREFLNKVYPYRKIIPKDLLDNLFKYFLDHDYEPNVKDSNEILGGYNPIIWKSDRSFGITEDSFMFSFKDKNSIENYILSRVKDKRYAIYNYPSHGPAFGCGLVLSGNNFYNSSYCRNMKNKYPNYEKSIRETEYFSVEEYEIFQITKD
ncbi:BTB/POZ protein [Rhizophagus irregularis DAOM 181602=DAOM 197198]|nr:BTB/POZ protein [Rhizophagus irregularis DAOM 181602=DAOM 197198]